MLFVTIASALMLVPVNSILSTLFISVRLSAEVPAIFRVSLPSPAFTTFTVPAGRAEMSMLLSALFVEIALTLALASTTTL